MDNCNICLAPVLVSQPRVSLIIASHPVPRSVRITAPALSVALYRGPVSVPRDVLVFVVLAVVLVFDCVFSQMPASHLVLAASSMSSLLRHLITSASSTSSSSPRARRPRRLVLVASPPCTRHSPRPCHVLLAIVPSFAFSQFRLRTRPWRSVIATWLSILAAGVRRRRFEHVHPRCAQTFVQTDVPLIMHAARMLDVVERDPGRWLRGLVCGQGEGRMRLPQ